MKYCSCPKMFNEQVVLILKSPSSFTDPPVTLSKSVRCNYDRGEGPPPAFCQHYYVTNRGL